MCPDTFPSLYLLLFSWYSKFPEKSSVIWSVTLGFVPGLCDQLFIAFRLFLQGIECEDAEGSCVVIFKYIPEWANITFRCSQSWETSDFQLLVVSSEVCNHLCKQCGIRKPLILCPSKMKASGLQSTQGIFFPNWIKEAIFRSSFLSMSFLVLLVPQNHLVSLWPHCAPLPVPVQSCSLYGPLSTGTGGYRSQT